jgi:hypothetical protein
VAEDSPIRHAQNALAQEWSHGYHESVCVENARSSHSSPCSRSPTRATSQARPTRRPSRSSSTGPPRLIASTRRSMGDSGLSLPDPVAHYRATADKCRPRRRGDPGSRPERSRAEFVARRRRRRRLLDRPPRAPPQSPRHMRGLHGGHSDGELSFGTRTGQRYRRVVPKSAHGASVPVRSGPTVFTLSHDH